MKNVTEQLEVKIGEQKIPGSFSWNQFESGDDVLNLMSFEEVKDDKKGLIQLLEMLNRAAKNTSYSVAYNAIKNGNISPEAMQEKWVSREALKMFKARAATGKPITMEKATATATKMYALREDLDTE